MIVVFWPQLVCTIVLSYTVNNTNGNGNGIGNNNKNIKLDSIGLSNWFELVQQRAKLFGSCFYH